MGEQERKTWNNTQPQEVNQHDRGRPWEKEKEGTAIMKNTTFRNGTPAAIKNRKTAHVADWLRVEGRPQAGLSSLRLSVNEELIGVGGSTVSSNSPMNLGLSEVAGSTISVSISWRMALQYSPSFRIACGHKGSM